MSSTFEKFPKETQDLLNSIMLRSTETVNVGEVMAVEGVVLWVPMAVKGVAPEVVTMEVPTEVPKSPWSPRSRPNLLRRVHRKKKGKQSLTPQLVCTSPRKNPHKALYKKRERWFT